MATRSANAMLDGAHEAKEGKSTVKKTYRSMVSVAGTISFSASTTGATRFRNSKSASVLKSGATKPPGAIGPRTYMSKINAHVEQFEGLYTYSPIDQQPVFARRKPELGDDSEARLNVTIVRRDIDVFQCDAAH